MVWLIIGILGLIAVVVLMFFANRGGTFFWIDRANQWGEGHMKEMGMEPEEKHPDDWPI